MYKLTYDVTEQTLEAYERSKRINDQEGELEPPVVNIYRDDVYLGFMTPRYKPSLDAETVCIYLHPSTRYSEIYEMVRLYLLYISEGKSYLNSYNDYADKKVMHYVMSFLPEGAYRRVHDIYKRYSILYFELNQEELEVFRERLNSV